MYAEKIPTTADKLDRVPRWQCGLGQLPGRLGRPTGRNASELETLEPRAVSGQHPVISARLYFVIQAARRSVVAIWLGGHVIWAESRWFSLRRNRSIAPRRHQGGRGNRTSARVSRPCREEKQKHARDSPTKYGFGRAAPVMYPAAVFILAQRKPMPAMESGDVAVSALSPLLFPRRPRPLGGAKETSAKKWSDALRRQRRRCVPLRRTSPSWRNKPTPAH